MGMDLAWQMLGQWSAEGLGRDRLRDRGWSFSTSSIRRSISVERELRVVV